MPRRCSALSRHLARAYLPAHPFLPPSTGIAFCSYPSHLQPFPSPDPSPCIADTPQAFYDPRPSLSPSHVLSLASLLRSCSNLRQGHHLHSCILKWDLAQNVFLGNLILQMYGRCHAIADARACFEKMHLHDQYSWNFMVSAYTHNDEWDLALELFHQIYTEGFVIDDYILSSALSACACHGTVEQGQRLHSSIIRHKWETVEAVQNALLNFYGKCGRHAEALRVFNCMQDKGVISWSSMIAAYSKQGLGESAIGHWNRMLQEGMLPAKATFLAIFEACCSQAVLSTGKQVHGCLLGASFELDVKVKSALVNMYGKCGDMYTASKIFQELTEQNVVSWTIMIAGYARNGHSKEALEHFEEMQRKGVPPNQVTFVSILDAYGSKHLLDKAKQMHARIKHNGYDSDVIVGTALVNMYGKCSSPKDARKMFEEMPSQNVISWNAIISIYAQHGLGNKAMQLFYSMLQKQLKPNEVTFICMMSACGNVGALIEGKWLHDQVIKQSIDADVTVGNAMISMYSKCGHFESAQNVFERLCNRNIISWSTIIAVYAKHGHGKRVLPMLQQMKEEGLQPNYITFKVVLSACNHAGLLDDAFSCINSMSKIYGIEPSGEHYDCVVDLIGRVGRLDDVEDLIRKMPVQPTLISWLVLLGACSSQNDLERAERTANQIFEMYPESSAPYIILSNMYVSADRDEDAEVLLSRMKYKGLMKSQDICYMEVNGKLHEFSLEDHTDEICLQIEALNKLIHDSGFEYMINPDQDEQNDYSEACRHTERIAIAFGFLNTPPKATLFIIKSVQMCTNCHVFVKLVSKLCQRQIVINDIRQLHRMCEGSCSCGD